MTGELPSGTRASIFEDYEIGDCIYSYFESVNRYINELCKFYVISWAKCGEVQDQGVDQPSNGITRNAARVMIYYGTLNHHITWIYHMRPSDVNVDMLNLHYANDVSR